MFGGLGGMDVVVSPYCSTREQVKFPKTKKRRIRKKWAKRSENWVDVPWDYAIQMGGQLICHPVFYDKLMTSIASLNAKRAS